MIIETKGARLGAIQARFAEIRQSVDTVFGPVTSFSNTHRVEAYKAILKSFAVRDEPIVSDCVAECTGAFAGAPTLVYPMLHLPADTNEYGTWHRDGASYTQRVFWLPMTAYEYSGISYVAGTYGAASPVSSTVLSKVQTIGPLETPMTIRADCYYSWPPRLTHRGNLNVSDKLSAAMVIFMDPDATAKPGQLEIWTPATISDHTRAIQSAISFGADGNVEKFSPAPLAAVPAAFVDTFHSFFSLRTKYDLKSAS